MRNYIIWLKKNGADLIQFDFLRFCDEALVKPISYCREKDCFDANNQLIVSKEYLVNKIDNVCWNRFYHNSIFDGLRFPDFISGEDAVVKAFILINAKKIIYIHEAFYYYRERPGSLTTSSFSLVQCLEFISCVIHELVRQKLCVKDEEVVLSFVTHVFCFRVLHYRNVWVGNVRLMYDNILKKHFEDICEIYPNYKEKLIEMSNKKNKKRLKLLFLYPYIYMYIMYCRSGIKNLWHKLF